MKSIFMSIIMFAVVMTGFAVEPTFIADVVKEHVCNGQTRTSIKHKGYLYYRGRGNGMICRTDGTKTGTNVIIDMANNEQAYDYPVKFLVNINDEFVFASKNDIWRSDGTQDGTILIATNLVAVPYLVENVVYFAVENPEDDTTVKLYKYDNTPVDEELPKTFSISMTKFDIGVNSTKINKDKIKIKKAEWPADATSLFDPTNDYVTIKIGDKEIALDGTWVDNGRGKWIMTKKSPRIKVKIDTVKNTWDLMITSANVYSSIDMTQEEIPFQFKTSKFVFTADLRSTLKGKFGIKK